MPFTTALYAALADLAVPFVPPPAAEFDDDALLAAQRSLAEIRRRVDAAAAVVSAEIGHRSRPELGYSGLAQRRGVRTPEALVQHITGFTARDSRTLVRVGALVTPPADDPTPWLRSVARAVAAGSLSVDAADAIRAGLGVTDGEVTVEALSSAAERLVGEASGLTVEKLAARARDLRNELDLAGVRDREERLRERRYLHLVPQADGMTRISGLLDPESAALIVSAVDAATSPRRGGPRFVDPLAAADADALVDDPRTIEQLAVDALVELVTLGGAADARSIIGGRRPAVQVVVAERDLLSRQGFGHLEGQSEAVSIETVERHVCSDGAVPVILRGGQVVNLGREQRYFSRHQRIGLAVRDGGCRFPDCDRPPSWTEAHHIDHWTRDRGRTDMADGVLLCRHHHMLVHNNGWGVTRQGSDYFVVPPPDLDPAQRPIAAPSKSPIVRRMAEAG